LESFHRLLKVDYTTDQWGRPLKVLGWLEAWFVLPPVVSGPAGESDHKIKSISVQRGAGRAGLQSD